MNENQTKLEKKVFHLQILCVVMILTCGLILLTGFASQTKQKFGEIDVERINIVEKDGKLDMVISNQERQHPGILDGKVIQRTEPRSPGILFFNHIGDEMGGLVFGGQNNGQGGVLTFDKLKNAEVMKFLYNESNGTYETGLFMGQQSNMPFNERNTKFEAAMKITDETKRKAALKEMRERGELQADRLFLGKKRDNSTILEMKDIKGKTRITMQVAADGTPKLDFLDADGKIIYSLPEKPQSAEK